MVLSMSSRTHCVLEGWGWGVSYHGLDVSGCPQFGSHVLLLSCVCLKLPEIRQEQEQELPERGKYAQGSHGDHYRTQLCLCCHD